ncbi:MAG: cardiolipin synthase [Planctomycetes bacterium]|nr:cardiolipin synthase [Planctomycetota bacterium]
MSNELLTGLIIILVFCEFAGVFTAMHALFNVRSPQATVAWCMGLLGLPVLVLPLYWVFGRSRFQGYREAMRDVLIRHAKQLSQIRGEMAELMPERADTDSRLRVFNSLTDHHFTRGNRVRLLVDGEETFAAILEAIECATSYVLVEFYIFRDDELGSDFKAKLIERAQAGVRVYVLFDRLGSHGIRKRYVKELQIAGVKVSRFNTIGRLRNRFQLNFRNHRKIVVVDGRVAFVGGLNVGDEYLGKDPDIGYWRDTHLEIKGPAVQMTQSVFALDWHWAEEELLDLNWQLAPVNEHGVDVLTLPTGPADDVEACTLFFVSALNGAKSRVWIASPYFVPDESVINAMSLAVLRGVDVRVIIPAKSDSLVVHLAAFTFFQRMESIGVKLYRYEKGFLHQKVVVVDDTLASIGTANLSNRSFRLNFELNILVANSAFAEEVAYMLRADFDQCSRGLGRDFTDRWIGFRAAARAARLFAPIL